MDSGIRKILPLLGIAVLVTVAVLAVFTFISPKKESGGDESGKPEQAFFVPVVEKKDAETILFDFKSLKKKGLSTEGLNSAVGEPSAYIVIHKFADFMCPHCKTGSLVIDEAVKRWPGRIKVYYRHFPLDGTCNRLVERKDPEASRCNGAYAAICAPEQKILKPMYDGIFNFQNTHTVISPEALEKLTVEKGGNWSKMIQCMGSADASRRLERDINDAEKLQIQATPTLVVEDRLQNAGAPPLKDFLHLMDSLVMEKEGEKALEELRTRLNNQK